MLVAIGWEPHTEFIKDTVPLDDRGYVIVNAAMETELPGVFAVGDIRHGSPRQVAAAVGDGVISAVSVQKYLMGACCDGSRDG